MPEILATYDFTYASNAYSVTCNNKASATRAVVPKSYDDGSHGEYPVKTISASAFSGCTTLTTLVVPSSITSMGDSAFNGCSSLESVTLLGETPATLGTNVFAGTSANIKFYCTQSSLATYKAASGWSTYKNNMFGDDLRIYFEMNAIYAKDYFASKEYTQEQLSGKLDKVTETSFYTQVYGKTTGSDQVMYNLNTATSSNSIVLRDGAGRAKIADPSADADIANKKYVDDTIAALPEPMIFKGTLGTGGTITSLPTAASSNEGWTYKVITAGTYASQSAKVGDVFISNGSSWNLIPSGDEPSGTVTNVATGVGLTGGPITTSGTIKAALVNETKSTNASSYTAGGTSKFYSVQLDKDGKLATYVPWTDNDHYPTAFTWTNGTSAGPTGSLTGNSGFTAVSFGAIPSASDTQSGILTNQSQTIGGLKIFKGNLAVMSGSNTIQLSAETSASGSSVYSAKLPLKSGTIAMTDQLPTIARYI